MVGWLKRIWRKNRASTRAIFHYWDGERMRSVDPIVAYRDLLADEKMVLEDHPILAANGDLDAMAICAAASRRAFGLKSYDGVNGQGTTDVEAVNVILQFGAWMGELKKNINGAPISVPSTASPSSVESTTKPASACGSTVPV